ncbi:MAG: metallophosphoesterase family protein [Bacteroidota bacterium]
MKILHTSDWHLGKRLENYSRLEEQKEVMEEICEIAEREQVDAVIVAGDLFDTFNPPTEAIDLFYKTLKRLANNGKRAVICIAGNHDSPDRIEAPDPLARECGILFAGYPGTVIFPFKLETGLQVTRSEPGFFEIKLPFHETLLRVISTPFANEHRMKTFLGVENDEVELGSLLAGKWNDLSRKYCNSKGVNILISHLFFVKNNDGSFEEPDDEKPILHVGGSQAIFSNKIPVDIQYVGLGHLHRKQQVDETPCPVIYPGSPLAYSFSEANQDKFVVIFEANPGKPVSYETVKLAKGKKLLKKEFFNMEEAMDWLKQHPDCLVEITLIRDQYITSGERKQLYNLHDGIIHIIPKITNKDLLEKSMGHKIDIQQDIKTLFQDYFTYRTGQTPNEEIMDLFKEILSENHQS